MHGSSKGKSIRQTLKLVRDFGNMENYLTLLLFDHLQNQTKTKNGGQGLVMFPNNNLFIWDSFRELLKHWKLSFDYFFLIYS